eukprot:872226-Prorocentrum_minimum.AAC.5
MATLCSLLPTIASTCAGGVRNEGNTSRPRCVPVTHVEGKGEHLDCACCWGGVVATQSLFGEI